MESVMFKKMCPLIILIFILVCQGECADVCCGQGDLETLLDTEGALLDSLHDYILYQENRFQLLKTYGLNYITIQMPANIFSISKVAQKANFASFPWAVHAQTVLHYAKNKMFAGYYTGRNVSYEYYHSEYEVAQKDVVNYLSNPINAFKLIKRLHKDWKLTEQIVLKDGVADFAKNMSDLKNVSVLPDEEDLTDAAEALMRLQDIYLLEAAELSDGILNGKKECSPMTMHDCFELGGQALGLKFYTRTAEWMSAVLSKWDAKHNDAATKIVILDYLAYSYYKIGKFTLAVNITHDLLLLAPDDEIHVKNLEVYENLKRKIETGEPAVSQEMERYVYSNYNELCRGDLELPDVVKKDLKCRYLSDKSPFLRLARVKVEEYYLDPYVALFHDVIYESEIKIILEIVKTRVNAGEVDYVLKWGKSKARVSKSGWILDNEHEIIQKINQRITDITGLSMESAESLQVANYGIGGHYEPHFDFSTKDDIHGMHLGKDPAGNRIATLMFYLSDVTLGGYTVFPNIGVAAIPRKGSAIFWLNLHSSGEGDLATYHAGCPVLRGNKWVANKWIRQRGQEFRRPCDLKYTEEKINVKIPEPVFKSNISRKM